MKRFLLAAMVFLSADLAVAAEPPLTNQQRVANIKTFIQDHQVKEASEAGKRLTPDLPSDQKPGTMGLKLIQAMFLCLGVFFVGIFIYRKKTGAMPFKRAGRIKVVDRMMISGKTSLVLAEIDGREVLLSVGGEQVAFFQNAPHQRSSERLELLCSEPETLRPAAHS